MGNETSQRDPFILVSHQIRKIYQGSNTNNQFGVEKMMYAQNVNPFDVPVGEAWTQRLIVYKVISSLSL